MACGVPLRTATDRLARTVKALGLLSFCGIAWGNSLSGVFCSTVTGSTRPLRAWAIDEPTTSR
ncbi:hypothetical protein D3C79_1054400 [compost metagenome]